MDAIKFLEEKNRMTKNCIISCDDCPLSIANNGTDNGTGSGCVDLECHDPEKYVGIVEEWSRSHPRKTRQSEFLKVCPKAPLDSEGIIRLSPCAVGEHSRDDHLFCCKLSADCQDCRKKFWLEEIEDEEYEKPE